MLQFLRRHARQDDFLQTVAKARRFAEAQEAARPKNAVRIVEDKEKDHGDDVARSGQPDFQPLIDGFRKGAANCVKSKPNSGDGDCGVRDEGFSSPEGKYSVAPRKARQDQARQEQQPQQQQSGKSGAERTLGNTPERESRRNGNGSGNRYPKRSGSVSPGRDDYRPTGQRFGRSSGRGNGNGNGYYRASSADSYCSGASSCQKPGNFGSPSPRSRYSDESNQRSYPPRKGMARSYQPRTGYGRTFYGPDNQRLQNNIRSQEARSSRPPGDESSRPTTPPPQRRRRCYECGNYGCHSELHYGVPRRNANQGCFVCGRYGCHSFFHAGQEQGPRRTGSPSSFPQGSENSENGQRGPCQGNRPPQQPQNSPSFQ